jgi:hypothetical protein
MDDLVKIATAFFTLAGLFITAYMAYLMSKLNAGQQQVVGKMDGAAVKVDKAAVKVESVRAALVESNDKREQALENTVTNIQAIKNDLAENTKTTNETHKLVNGQDTKQKELYALLARKLADSPSGSLDDKVIAEAAERDAKDHRDVK